MEELKELIKAFRRKQTDCLLLAHKTTDTIEAARLKGKADGLRLAAEDLQSYYNQQENPFTPQG